MGVACSQRPVHTPACMIAATSSHSPGATASTGTKSTLAVGRRWASSTPTMACIASAASCPAGWAGGTAQSCCGAGAGCCHAAPAATGHLALLLAVAAPMHAPTPVVPVWVEAAPPCGRPCNRRRASATNCQHLPLLVASHQSAQHALGDVLKLECREAVVPGRARQGPDPLSGVQEGDRDGDNLEAERRAGVVGRISQHALHSALRGTQALCWRSASLPGLASHVGLSQSCPRVPMGLPDAAVHIPDQSAGW